MEVLNEFLKIICHKVNDNDEMHTIFRDFLEPDTNDKKISGGSVIRTVTQYRQRSVETLYSNFAAISDRDNRESIEIWNENDKKYARYARRWYVDTQKLIPHYLSFISISFYLLNGQNLISGVAKILLGRGAVKETAFLQDTPLHLDHSSEYPALTSALNLLDEVFDLQARSQWLRRGLINRLLGV